MDVVLTGASGRVGTAIVDHLDDHDEYDFTYVDIEPLPDHDTVTADVTDYESIRPVLDGADAVIHLAYVRSPKITAWNREIEWSQPFEGNLKGICNVVDAAIDAGLDKMIFASSNHAVGMYEVENAPDIYYPDFDLVIDHTVPIRPDSLYGLTKVYGEGMGRLAAEAHGLQYYALRLGAIREREYDHPYGDAERDVDQGEIERGSDEYNEQVARMKAMWQSRRDLAQMVDLCLQDETVEFDIFYGASANDRTWFDIEHARDVLGYDPQDNGDEWDAPPG